MKLTNTAMPGILLATLLAALSGSVQADGTPEAGKEKAKMCEACHGPDGKGIAPNYPNLAGQHASYLVKALADYRAGRRTNPIMGPMAVNLSDQDVEDLAAWFASLDGLKDLSIQ